MQCCVAIAKQRKEQTKRESMMDPRESLSIEELTCMLGQAKKAAEEKKRKLDLLQQLRELETAESDEVSARCEFSPDVSKDLMIDLVSDEENGSSKKTKNLVQSNLFKAYNMTASFRAKDGTMKILSPAVVQAVEVSYKCPICNGAFTNPGNQLQHYKACAKRDAEKTKNIPALDARYFNKGAAKRNSYTNAEKMSAVLFYLEGGCVDGTIGPWAAERCYPYATVIKWVNSEKARDDIVKEWADCRKGRRGGARAMGKCSIACGTT